MNTIRTHFPALSRTVNGHRYAYVDNAATTHKPQQVIDAITTFYCNSNANVGRGIYQAAESATEQYEDARHTVARFINADARSIVFTRGATDGINMVARGIAHLMSSGDQLVVTELEHHSNVVPWQQLAQSTGAVVQAIPVTRTGCLDYSSLDTIITNKTKLVAVTAASNVLSTPIDVHRIIVRARAVGALVLVDAAQAMIHGPVDVQKMDTDFLVFSGHKMFGPTGIGVLYCASAIVDQLHATTFGGGAVTSVTTHDAQLLPAPHCFEAGTPPLAQAIGLAAAVNYIEHTISWKTLQSHESQLITQLSDGLSGLPGVSIVCPDSTGHILSFTVEGTHPHDVAAVLDKHGIAVRAGNHCAQPLMNALSCSTGTVRVSVAAYNDVKDIAWVIRVLSEYL